MRESLIINFLFCECYVYQVPIKPVTVYYSRMLTIRYFKAY